jgi:hypothetical protein
MQTYEINLPIRCWMALVLRRRSERRPKQQSRCRSCRCKSQRTRTLGWRKLSESGNIVGRRSQRKGQNEPGADMEGVPAGWSILISILDAHTDDPKSPAKNGNGEMSEKLSRYPKMLSRVRTKLDQSVLRIHHHILYLDVVVAQRTVLKVQT